MSHEAETRQIVGLAIAGFTQDLAAVRINAVQGIERDYKGKIVNRGRICLTIKVMRGLRLDSPGIEAISEGCDLAVAGAVGLRNILARHMGQDRVKLIEPANALPGLDYLVEANNNQACQVEGEETLEIVTEAILAFTDEQKETPMLRAIALPSYEALSGYWEPPARVSMGRAVNW